MNWKLWVSGAVLLLVALGSLVGLYLMVENESLGFEISLPILAIAGVVSLLITLGLLAGSYTIFGLTNRNEALGLPQGTVRAVIALSLIVLFAIFAVFLYADMSHERPVEETPELTGSQRDAFLEAVPRASIVVTIPNGKSGSDERFSIYYRNEDQGTQASQDFAKQLLVMIGTLVTSVASFYFGSKAASVSTDPIAAKSMPSLRNVDPNVCKMGQTCDLKIGGDNLDLVKEAKITLGSQQIVAKNLTSNASVVRCTVDVPSDASVGAWTVTVNDGTGQQAELPGSFTVSA